MKPGYLSEKLKTLRSSISHKVYSFLLKFCTRFLLNNVYKRVFRIFSFLFRPWVIKKNVKNECVETRSFLTFANNSRSKPNKKNPKHLFVEMISTKGVRSVSQKYWTLWYLERIKVFTFSDKKPGFSKTIELCLNFYLGFRIT